MSASRKHAVRQPSEPPMSPQEIILWLNVRLPPSNEVDLEKYQRARRLADTLSPIDWQRQHDVLPSEPSDTAGEKRQRREVRNKIDWYYRRCLINDDQHAAGTRFFVYWTIGHGTSIVTPSYGERVQRAPTESMSDRQIHARQEIDGALKFLRDHHRDVVITVCGLDSWPNVTRGVDYLREALTDLAKYWKC
jgi:hypothetical protein